MRRQLARNWVFLLVVMLVLAAFEFALCAVVANMDVATALNQISTFAPPVMRAMIEQNMAGGSPAAVLSFGWNHPIAHALLTAVAITLAARAIAGEIETGAIELVLSQPISRAQYFGAHVLFGAGALSVVLAGGMLGTAFGQQIFALNAFGPERLALLFLNAFLLQFAIYALTLAVSAFGRESGRVALVGALLAVFSLIINVIGALWSKAEFAKPLSLHSYFEPRDILTLGHLPGSSLLILAVVAGIAITAAFARFVRRDLP
ncbi:MAG: ABC transporter permease [Betaproteobacteria bacterium]